MSGGTHDGCTRASPVDAMAAARRVGGLIPSRPLTFGPPPENLLAFAPGQDQQTVALWLGMANPTDRQTGGRCGGNGAENMIETMLRRDVPQEELHAAIRKKLGHLRWRIDGDRLHDEVRRAVYHDNGQGLRIADIERIPEITGILGPFGVARIAKGWRARFEALKRGPVGGGVALGAGWDAPDPYVLPLVPDPRAGHFMAWMGALMQGGAPYDLPLNSWGQAWGKDGAAIVHAEFTDYCTIDHFFQWVVEAGWHRRGRWIEYVKASDAT